MDLWIIVGHNELRLEVILSPVADVDRHGGGLLRQLQLVAARLVPRRVQEGSDGRDLVGTADERVLIQKLVDKPEGKTYLEVLGGAATCSEGFVIYPKKVPLTCLGCMAVAVQPNSLWNFQKINNKTFGRRGRIRQP